MPRQPSTLFESHTKQQPFTLTYEHEAWHVAFPGHRCELDIHGTRIEAQAIARCYHSLFLAPGAPFAYAEMSECEMLDLAEREAAIEIEVQQRRMQALLYYPGGDGALPSTRVEESPVRYQAGDACLQRVRAVKEDYPDGAHRVASDSHHPVIYRMKQHLDLVKETSRSPRRRESLIDTAFLWKEHVLTCRCRFDVEQKALDAVVFTQTAGGQTLAIPSKLEGVSRRQATLSAIRRAQTREPWQSLALTLVRDRGFDEILAIWRGRLVGTVRAKHIPWLRPLLDTGLVGCYVLQITGGTPGRDTMGCNVTFTGVG